MTFTHVVTKRRRLLALIALLAAVDLIHAQESPSVEAVMDRFGAYLLDYETKVFELVADEQYDQRVKRSREYGGATIEKRKLRSTFFLVRLPDGQAWYGFREVTSVNGRRLPSRERSLAAVLGERTIDAYNEAIALTHESAKYNLGPVYRTINVPLQALELLHPSNRARFRFILAGEERIAGQRAHQIDFEERARPTIISDLFGGNLPTRGRIWIEPITGAVLRTELRVDAGPASFLTSSLIRVDYRRDSHLDILLPSEMEEVYSLDSEELHGHASYRNYRRFQTSARVLPSPN